MAPQKKGGGGERRHTDVLPGSVGGLAPGRMTVTGVGSPQSVDILLDHSGILVLPRSLYWSATIGAQRLARRIESPDFAFYSKDLRLRGQARTPPGGIHRSPSLLRKQPSTHPS